MMDRDSEEWKETNEALKDNEQWKAIQESLRIAKQGEVRANKIADKIVECLEGVDPEIFMDQYMLHVQLPKALGEKFMHLFDHKESRGCTENPLMEAMLDSYVSNYIGPMIENVLEYIWTNQEGKEEDYGDLDWRFDKYYENSKHRVSLVSDFATMSDKNKWIIVEDKERGRIHIRIIYDDEESDYPESAYPQKLSLQFHKDRDFNMEHVKKLHMTKLGGVYGDSRDTGYVLTLQIKDSFLGDLANSKGCIYYYAKIGHICRMLKYTEDEIKSAKETK